jgi:hypothetical protein
MSACADVGSAGRVVQPGSEQYRVLRFKEAESMKWTMIGVGQRYGIAQLWRIQKNLRFRSINNDICILKERATHLDRPLRPDSSSVVKAQHGTAVNTSVQ